MAERDYRFTLDNVNNSFTNRVLNVWAETVLSIINPTSQIGKKSVYITFVDYMLVNYHNIDSKCVDLLQVAQQLNAFKAYIFNLNEIGINIRLIAELTELTATQFNHRVERQRDIWTANEFDGVDCMNGIKLYDELIKQNDSPF